MFIDTHTHLFLEHFSEDIDEVMSRAIDRDIQRFYLPNIDRSTFDEMMALAGNYPGKALPLIGLHPCSVKEDFEEELSFVDKKARGGGFFGIGETGIDLYWDKTFFEQQRESFARQIELAKELALPIIIHCRESFDEIFEIVDRLNDERLSGIFHCFTGDLSQANRIIDYGRFKLGMGGVLTFKNSGLDKTIVDVPLQHLVLETDSPYLAPVPYRGKRNESSYLIEVAKKLGEIKGVSIEEVAEITTDNANEVFNFG
ncbi:MAG TPA: TatD family deoxyribonuclease [Flavobacteriales bacterium]|jgi:TatD DNase family protein|nr:TatD family deoxyribonuclease [Flavobacteriales bacterium]HIO68286.1 TatD family deoxyribonuclease [Flavobacteriales bacterium]